MEDAVRRCFGTAVALGEVGEKTRCHKANSALGRSGITPPEENTHDRLFG